MDQNIHDWLLRELPKISERPQVLGFSCGADSVASLIRMREWGLKPELVYLYFIPGLPMIESYLRYVEDKLGQRVYRIPSKMCMEYMLNGLLQHPGVGHRMYEQLKAAGQWVPSTADINAYMLESFPDAMLAIGLRVSDGIFRAKLLREKGPVAWAKGEWYPVADCFRSDIVNIIRDARWKLPVDYKLFGRSFESLRHWTAPPIKQHCPKTWAKLLEFFPKANLLCGQDALIPRSRDIQSRITSYGPLAFQNEDCTA